MFILIIVRVKILISLIWLTGKRFDSQIVQRTGS